MIEMLHLNDDCLGHVLLFLDLKSLCVISATCKRLEQIADGIFRRHHKYYECTIDVKEDFKEAHKVLRKIGPHLVELRLTINPVDTEFRADKSIGCQFFARLNCSLGDNFRKLSVHGKMLSIPIERLAPTLSKLENLMIRGIIEETEDEPYTAITYVDLPQFCPNLRVLRIEDCALIFAPNPNNSFQNLEVLIFGSMGCYYPTQLFESFIQNNQRLKVLHIDNIHDNLLDPFIDLTIVAKNLKRLEDLRIRTIFFRKLRAGVRDLTGLQHLSTLAMSEYWNTPEEVNEILNILQSMTQLKTLWIDNCIGSASINQQSIVNIAKNLRQLESFICYGMECELDTVAQIVQLGRKLKQFCVQVKSEVVVTVAFIEHLANIRRLAASERSPLIISLGGESKDVQQVKIHILPPNYRE